MDDQYDQFLAQVLKTWVMNALAKREGKPTIPEMEGEAFKQAFIDFVLELLDQRSLTQWP